MRFFVGAEVTRLRPHSGVRRRSADVRRRRRVRGRVRPPRLVQRLRTRPRGGGPRPGPSFARAGGDRRAAGGHSPAVPIRRQGTGHLGLLTACSVRAEPGRELIALTSAHPGQRRWRLPASAMGRHRLADIPHRLKFPLRGNRTPRLTLATCSPQKSPPAMCRRASSLRSQKLNPCDHDRDRGRYHGLVRRFA